MSIRHSFPQSRFAAGRRILLVFALLALLVAWTALRGENPSSRERPEELVPAAMGIRTDRQGNSWNVESNGTIGRIGNTLVNSGLALSINEEKFVSSQPLMTPDAREFVLSGRPLANTPGVQVQRRIRLVERKGFLRYVERFHNESTDPVRLNISLLNNFSGNYKTFVTDRGRTEPVLLASGETGVVVIPGATQSTRAYLFVLADGASELLPSISSQNRYGLTFQYSVTLKPGETKILQHHVAQVVIPGNFDRRTLLSLFRPFSFAENASGIPEEWKPLVMNRGGDLVRGAEPRELTGLESLGIEPGQRDLLVIGENTRLVGAASGGPVSIESVYGTAEVPLPAVAGISGGRHEGSGLPRIFLRDGQVFRSALAIPDFAFEQSGGGTVDLETAEMDRLVFAADEDPEPEANPVAVIETHQGDRVHVAEGGSLRFEVLTPWGSLPVSPEKLDSFASTSHVGGSFRLETTWGMSCFALPAESSLDVSLDRFGSTPLQFSAIKRVFTPIESDPRGFGASPGLALVETWGSQRIPGEISDTSLPVISEGILIETAVANVRRMERVRDVVVSPGRMADDAPSFEIERWDGGVMTGFVDLEILSLKVAGRDWKVPLRDIERILTPSPDLLPETLATIRQFISNLGAEEWRTREKATRELGAFGYLAKSVLEEELRNSLDPEVNRRIERILSGLN